MKAFIAVYLATGSLFLPRWDRQTMLTHSTVAGRSVSIDDRSYFSQYTALEAPF